MAQRARDNNFSMDVTVDSKPMAASDYLRQQLGSRSMPKVACPVLEGELQGFNHFDHLGEPHPRSKESL